MFICVSDVFISLVWPPKAAAGAFFSAKKDVPGILEHANSEKCTKCVVLGVSSTSSQNLQI